MVQIRVAAMLACIPISHRHTLQQTLGFQREAQVAGDVAVGVAIWHRAHRIMPQGWRLHPDLFRDNTLVVSELFHGLRIAGQHPISLIEDVGLYQSAPLREFDHVVKLFLFVR